MRHSSHACRAENESRQILLCTLQWAIMAGGAGLKTSPLCRSMPSPEIRTVTATRRKDLTADAPFSMLKFGGSLLLTIKECTLRFWSWPARTDAWSSHCAKGPVRASYGKRFSHTCKSRYFRFMILRDSSPDLLSSLVRHLPWHWQARRGLSYYVSTASL